jgi:hypothetical protein
MGVCSATAHPILQCGPKQLLVASCRDFAFERADVDLDCPCCFPVRTPSFNFNVQISYNSSQHNTHTYIQSAHRRQLRRRVLLCQACNHAAAHHVHAPYLELIRTHLLHLISRSVAKLLVLHRMIDFASRSVSVGRRRVQLASRSVLALVLLGNAVGVVSNAVCAGLSVQLVSLFNKLSDAQARGASSSKRTQLPHLSPPPPPPPPPSAAEICCLTRHVLQTIPPPKPCLPKPLPSLPKLTLQPAFSCTARSMF